MAHSLRWYKNNLKEIIMDHDRIAVIDFGGQYAHLIATKVRRSRVLAEIRQPEDPAEVLGGYRGVIISGSPSLSSHDEDPVQIRNILDLDIPVLGICFGHQAIVKHYGGRVVHGDREWGRSSLHKTGDHPLFRGLETIEQVWMSHYDSVAELGDRFEEIGYSAIGSGAVKHHFAAVASDELKRYGLQFHPEVDDTQKGERILENFVLDICGCKTTWTMENYVGDITRNISDRVGDGSVLLLVSGGVDSTVVAKLISMAIGARRLHLLHIDNGMMRKGESREVLRMLRELGMGHNLHFRDAGETFTRALRGVADPEKKRKIIGETFIEVFEREAARLNLRDFLLGQGTIYPDTIETGGTRRADTIKTHHNRVPLMEEMISRGEVIEPISELYKAEVRELGGELGIDEECLLRHPFPGPGLGIRLLCSSGIPEDEETDTVGNKVGDIAGAHGLDSLLLPIRSVGVKGDLRSYEHPVLLSGRLPWDELLIAASIILSEVDGINRCIWNPTDTRPREARSRAADVCRKRLELLREVDREVMEALKRHGLYHNIWQCPTVLAPLEIDGKGKELVIIRPVHSGRGMTASPAHLPRKMIEELCRSILRFHEISGLCIDITSKPPGTIEWE